MPGPTFTRPTPPTDRTPQRRADLDALLARRVDALRHTGTGGPYTPEQIARDADDARLIEALVHGFADAVDRENGGRMVLRQGVPIEYVDAVVIAGSGGQLVAEAVEYDAAPVYWQARAGEVDSVVHGNDLDGYLRTGEDRYARAIGLR